jgi:hypothetical protein
MNLPNNDKAKRSIELEKRFDHIIWVGDFNYRVTGDRNEILALASGSNYAKLLEKD